MVGMVPGRCAYVSHMFVGWRRAQEKQRATLKTEKQIRSCAVFVLASSLPPVQSHPFKTQGLCQKRKNCFRLVHQLNLQKNRLDRFLIGSHNSIVKDTMMCAKRVRRFGRFSSTLIDNFFADPATGRRRRGFPWPGLMR